MLRHVLSTLTPTLESTLCVACGGPLDLPRLALKCGSPVTGGEILRCTSCGSYQVTPRPSSQVLAKLYNADYYESAIAGPGIIGGTTEVSPVLQKRLAEIELRIKRGRLLDVGCGFGFFVKYAVDRGWDASGLEVSGWAAEEGRRRNNVVIHVTELGDAPFEPESLDVIHSNHVFEHLLDPVSTMASARRLLRPGGLLVIEVPQELKYPLSDRVFRRLHPELYRSAPPTVTHHLTFFSVGGLRSAARRAGFRVESVSTVRHIRTDESRIPFGVAAKRLLYWSEAFLQTAPDIELWATR